MTEELMSRFPCKVKGAREAEPQNLGSNVILMALSIPLVQLALPPHIFYITHFAQKNLFLLTQERCF